MQLVRLTYTVPGRHIMATDTTRTEVGYLTVEGDGYWRLQDKPVAWSWLRSIPVGRVLRLDAP